MSIEHLPEAIVRTAVDGAKKIAITPVQHVKNPGDLLNPVIYVGAGADMGLKTAEVLAGAGFSAVGAVAKETSSAVCRLLSGAAKGTLKAAASVPVLPFRAAA